ncbi:hypothetical protein BJY04DRAFT_37925 [Aspergillus karnatakaensis]|uniref:SAP domain-containing protein n=1 Tax=Aspergillus karnatakaensis TaxID=1810916 RepID=UPI003CCDB558
MATDYAKKTNAELVEILKSRNLPHTGKKADMVARLQEDDSSKAAAPAKADIADDVIDWEDDEVPAAGSAAPKTAEPAAAAAAPAEDAPAVEATTAEETKAEEAQGAEQNQEGSEGTVTGTTEEDAQPVEEKPAPNYSIGLSVTDLEEELKKRKARAEKFGITEDSQAAIDEAERKLQRAKRFGTAGEEAPSAESVSRLDQALPEKSLKRGRGENDQAQGGRGGKRRNFNGRNNQRQRGRGNRPQGQGQRQGQRQNQAQGQRQGQKQGTNKENGFSEKDKAAMEARAKRFAA